MPCLEVHNMKDAYHNIVKNRYLAVGYFVAINLIRISVLAGTDDRTYFQADYAAPPIILWISKNIGVPAYIAWTMTFLGTLLVLSSDIVTIESIRFHWGLEAVPQFIYAYHDLPWLLVLPIVAVAISCALLFSTLLFFSSRCKIAIWPMITFIAGLFAFDMVAGTVWYRPVYGRANIVTTSGLNLVSTYVKMAEGPKLFPMPQRTMYSLVPQKDPPTQILSIALESYGLARKKEQRDALIKPLLQEVVGIYHVTRGAHFFFGTTFQGEVRELCGLRLTGYPHEGKLLGRLNYCLPQNLGRLGYDSWALHGNGGQFYSRGTFYPLMGFRHVEFYKEIQSRYPSLRPCDGTIFRGVCDKYVYERALSLFDGNKRFVHVITLDTHLPTPPASRPACSSSFGDSEALCGYDVLLERSMSHLGKAIRNAKFKPDLIFIYGDHAPPFSNNKDREVFRNSQVPFLTLQKFR